MTAAVRAGPSDGGDRDFWWIRPAVIDDLRRLLGPGPRPLADYHRAGVLVARVRPRGPSPFDGFRWFAVFAARVGRSPGLLGRCQRLAELYPAEWVTRMAGAGLTWGHLSVLLRVRDWSARDELCRAAVANGWTAAELGRRAVGLTGCPAVAARPPRPLAAGYAALLGLRNLAGLAARFTARAGENWSGSRVPLAEQLRAALDSCPARLRAQIWAALQRLTPLLARVGSAAAAEHAALRCLLEDAAASCE